MLASLVVGLVLSSSAPLVADPVQSVVVEERHGDRGVMGYLRDAFTFGEPWSPAYDFKFLVYSYVCLQFCEFGSALWMPRIYFGDVPDNAAKRSAITLGILATVLAYIPTWVPILIPGFAFFGLGVVAAFLFNLFFHGFLFPRAIAIAMYDAEHFDDGKAP